MSNAFDKASLVMLPHAYEEGKVYSLKPTDRSGDFTYSRGTDTATRVGEDGYIKKEYVNKIIGSNDWALSNPRYTITGGEEGYDGSNDAWLVTKTDSGYFSKANLVYDGVLTASIYAKAGTLDRLFVFTAGESARFDLTNGTSEKTGGALIAHSIEPVGNDWYRCSMTFNKSETNNLLFKPLDSSNQEVNGTMYVQDGMLNYGLVAYPYVETTTAPVYGGLTDDMPRLDYSGGATCPSLLLEPSRTNLIKSSEWLGTGLQNLTVTIDDTISPEGYANVSKFTATTGSSKQTNGNIPFVAGITYTFSAWIKNIDASTVNIFWYDGTSNNNFFTDDVNTETFTRIQFSFTPVNTTSSGQLQIARDLPDGQSIYVYGAQLEQGSYPTSYIPTYGSSQTRAIDDLTSTPLSINGLFGPTSGSIFMEFTNPLQGLNNNWFSMTGVAAGATAYMRVRGYWQMNIAQLTWNPNPNLGSTNGATKIAVKWGDGVAKLFVDGQEDAASTYTGGDINMNGTLTGINGGFDFAENNANFKNIMFFQTALSDSECKALTAL